MEFAGFPLDLSSIEAASRPDSKTTYDLLILGGGAAAMTAAVYAARKMLKVALITRDFGGQMSDTTEVENYPGFQTITGRELVEKFLEQVKHFEVPVRKGEKISSVKKEGDSFRVYLESGAAFTSRTVILATGKRHRPLGVPGEQELVGKGVAYCATCEAPFYKDKLVVAGGANSAFTAALDLLKVAKEVTRVNFIRGWQADPVLIESIKKYDQLRLLDYHQIIRIEGKDSVREVHVKDRQTDKEKVIPAAGIFVEIGLLPNSEPVRHLGVLNTAGEVVVDCHCRTSIEGMFATGDVSTVPYKQIVISAGEGAKAALSAYEYLMQRGLL